MIKAGTKIPLQNGEMFEAKVDIELSIEQKEEILAYIGDTSWDQVYILGIANNEEINVLLSDYNCIEDLFQCIEFNPPAWLSLSIDGKEEYEVF